MTFEIVHRFFNKEQQREHIDVAYMAPRLTSDEIVEWQHMRDAYSALVRRMVDFWHTRRFRDQLTFKQPPEND